VGPVPNYLAEAGALVDGDGRPLAGKRDALISGLKKKAM